MHYALHCVDKIDASDVRRDNREAHLAHLASVADKILVAGPLLSADETQMVGSLLIIEFESLEEAEAFARNDPYARAGLFASVTVGAWKKVYPA